MRPRAHHPAEAAVEARMPLHHPLGYLLVVAHRHRSARVAPPHVNDDVEGILGEDGSRLEGRAVESRAAAQLREQGQVEV